MPVERDHHGTLHFRGPLTRAEAAELFRGLDWMKVDARLRHIEKVAVGILETAGDPRQSIARMIVEKLSTIGGLTVGDGRYLRSCSSSRTCPAAPTPSFSFRNSKRVREAWSHSTKGESGGRRRRRPRRQ